MMLRCLLLLGVLLGLSAPVAVADDWTHTLKRINDSGRFNLGYRADQTPMSFDQGGGEAAGYSVTLCQLIATATAETLGRKDLRLNYVPVTAEDRFDAIESGKIDILCGATTKTLSRAERVDFTQPTFVTGGGLLSRKDAKVDSLAELAGKRVAVVKGTTTIAVLGNALAANGIEAEVVGVDTTSEGMDLLAAGDVAAFSADQVVLIGQVISRGARADYALSSELFSFEPFALALQRGDADFRLLADRVLSQLYRSGDIARIYKRWFGSFGDQPPPMLRALYQLHATPL